jgi:hypothetical protein
MTPEEICRVGLEALRRELGLVGMIRFLQMFETGKGDYTAERHQWLDQMDLDTIVEEIAKRRRVLKESEPEAAGEEASHTNQGP